MFQIITKKEIIYIIKKQNIKKQNVKKQNVKKQKNSYLLMLILMFLVSCESIKAVL